VPTGRYDAIAEFYDSSVGDDVSDPPGTALLALAGDVEGLRILDLACGQGRVSRELARRGAVVVGLDVSGELLERARAAEAEAPLGIEYLHVDVASASGPAGERFDGAVCHFGLTDIDDLARALDTVAQTLRPDGWFVFSILHPCFAGFGDDAPSSWPPAADYHAEGYWLADNTGYRGRVGSNHRMLSTYVNELAERGLAIERVAEPAAAGKLRGATGPVYLVVRCRKGS